MGTTDFAGRDAQDRWIELAAACVCIFVSVLLFLLPHLLWWPRLGAPIWIADHDELGAYLAIGSKAYFNHPTSLSDPVRADDGGLCAYSWLQLVPGIALARALGLGPMGIGLVWRAWSGIFTGLGLYLVSRQYVKRPWIAAALGCLLIADIGLITGRPLIRQAGLCSAVLKGVWAIILRRTLIIRSSTRNCAL
ncbi:MAG: hypothetical protein IRY99_05345 [Isosphaeraceae bacterium]|nr:hypothetical protein [Isosphaeraceae bacterium]